MKIKALRIKKCGNEEYYRIRWDIIEPENHFTGFILYRETNSFESFKDSDYHSEFAPIPFERDTTFQNRNLEIEFYEWHLHDNLFAFTSDNNED